MPYYCPQCYAKVHRSAAHCAQCRTLFKANGLHPVYGLERPELLRRLGWATVIVPIAIFVLALLMVLFFPGCTFNLASGCHGCIFDDVLGIILWGGWLIPLIAAFTTLPFFLFLSAIDKRLQSK